MKILIMQITEVEGYLHQNRDIRKISKYTSLLKK